MRYFIPIIRASFFVFLLSPELAANNLHEAIRNSAQEALEKIGNGCSVETLDEICDGVAPIHLAVAGGHYEVVKRLIDKQANVNILNNKNESPAFIALERKFRDIFKLLMERGGSIRGEDVYDRLQLMPRSASDPLVFARHDDLAEEDFSPINLSDEQTTIRKMPRRIDTTNNHKKKKLTNKNSKTKLSPAGLANCQEFHITPEGHQIPKPLHRHTTFDVPKRELPNLPLSKLPTIDPDTLKKQKKSDRFKQSTISQFPIENRATSGELPYMDDGYQTRSRQMLPLDFNEGKLAAEYTTAEKKVLELRLKGKTEKQFDLNDVFYYDEMREHFVFIYPFLMDQFTVFANLHSFVQKKPRLKGLLCEIMHDFASEEFPYGLLSSLEVHYLGETLRLCSSEETSNKIFNALKNKEKKEQTKPPIPSTHKNKSVKKLLIEARETWEKTDISTLAQILTERDKRLFQNFSLTKLHDWLIDANQDLAIRKYDEESDKLIYFLALLIVSEANPDARRKQTKKIINLGFQFLAMNNFVGLANVVTTLLRTPVNRVLVWDEKLKKKFKELNDLVSFKGSYKNYRTKLQNIDQDQPCLPMANIITHDLQRKWEYRKAAQKNLDNQVEWFKQLALTLRSFQQFYNRSHLYVFDIINSVFFLLPLVPEDVIMEYSHSIEPWPRWQTEKANNAVYQDDSSFANLASRLTQWDVPEAIPLFLNHYIWDKIAFMDLLKPPDKEVRKENLANIGLDSNTIGNILLYVP